MAEGRNTHGHRRMPETMGAFFSGLLVGLDPANGILFAARGDGQAVKAYLVIVTLGVSIFGLCGLAWAWWSINRGWAAQRWPTAAGVITRSSVRECGRRHRFTYTPEVEYQYIVAGTEYRGQRIRFGGPAVNGSHGDAQRFLEAHPVGGAVTVRYCPSQPGISALEPGVGRGLFVLAVAYALLLLHSVSLIVVILTMWRK